MDEKIIKSCLEATAKVRIAYTSGRNERSDHIGIIGASVLALFFLRQ